MDFLKIPEQHLPQSNGLTPRARANSCQDIIINERRGSWLPDRRGSWLPDITRWRSASVLVETTIQPGVNNELLYKITDVVLIICATTFVICSFAYGVLWIYGAANSDSWKYRYDTYHK